MSMTSPFPAPWLLRQHLHTEYSLNWSRKVLSAAHRPAEWDSLHDRSSKSPETLHSFLYLWQGAHESICGVVVQPRACLRRKPSGAAPLGKDDSAHGGATDAPAGKL